MIRIRIQPYRLALKRAWLSAAGAFSERRGFLVTAMDDSGHCGYGDCAPLPQAGTESEQTALAWLNGCTPSGDVDDALDRLAAPQHCPPAARCGLETALLDLAARRQEQPLYRRLESAAPSTVRVNASLGSLPGITEKDVLDARGFPVIKLKLGTESVGQELKRLQRLCKALPEGVSLRLDANRAWTLQQAQSFIDATAELPIESLEEPLFDPDPVKLAELQARAGFPLALDETLASLPADQILSQRPVQRLVLKPMLLGGLLPALALARKAGAAGLESVVTTSVDSAVGTWAATHLAAAVNAFGTDLPHGLATGRWLLQDTAAGPCIRDASIRLVGRAGLGIQPTI